MAGEAGTIGADALSGAGMGASLGPYGALVGGVIGAGLGVYQAYGNKSDPKRPDYTIPPEVLKNLTMAQQMELEGLPEEQKQLYLRNLDRGTANGLRELGSRNAGLVGVAELNQQRNDGLANLLSADSQARMANKKTLMDVNNEVAGYRDQSWKLNELNPYYETLNRNQSQRGANVQNGIKGIETASYGLNEWYKSHPRKGKTNWSDINSGLGDQVSADNSYSLNNSYS